MIGSFLIACGGSGSDANTTNPNGDLTVAYSKIEGRMSYQQVRDIVGFDYKIKSVIGSYSILYIWQTGNFTPDFSQLSIGVDDKGVKSKSISVTNGKDYFTDSKSY